MSVYLRALIAVLACAAAFGTAAAEPRHGLSIFGDLKYPADFQNFEYVDPNAPKGGRIVTIGTGGNQTFNSLNGFILKGDPAQRLDLLFDSLMVRAFDEPDAMYGLVAESAELAPDRMGITFKLRPEARFADGTPVTAEDVAESLRLLKEDGHPAISIPLKDVVAAEVLGPHEIRYQFTGQNVRDLPQIVAALPVFSKAYYADKEFNATTLEPPLGSGPYKVGAFKQGSFITYVRRDDYWAKDLPVTRGQFNFDEIKLLYFRDRTAELEALKAGEIDLREEFTSKSWATEYELSSVREGRLIKEVLPDDTITGAQGFFINTRRAKFADPRVRRALDLAFDFEWSNANLFHGLYKRTHSFFENSPYKAEGKPSPEELKLLEPFRKELPPEVFDEVYVPPVSDGSGQDRKNLRKAHQLLEEAGWKLDGTRRVNDKGEPFTIEFLIEDPLFERIIGPYVRNLRLLGIQATIRQVEAAQYQERLENFDFDGIVQRFGVSQTPGTELRPFFGSAFADQPGSFNLSGVKSQAVDALIDHMIQAKSREELTIAARALDRVLRAHHIWIPHWYKASHTVAYWDIFGRPPVKPKFTRGIVETWWIDEEKAGRIRRGP